MYRCEAVSIAGFIQQLTVAYVANGYWFYVTGCIPTNKDPRVVDSKLIERYKIECSKWVRWRRKRRGLANVQYLRFRRFFVLLATEGEHGFFSAEPRIQDIRRNPIQCFGYSVGCYQDNRGEWRTSVRIDRNLFCNLKRGFLIQATRETSETLCGEFARLPFEPYAPVRRQVLQIFGAVNRARLTGGIEPLPIQTLRLKRKPVLPFGSVEKIQDV